MEVVGMKKENMRFEETELRLGIGSAIVSEEVVRKRGFSETETDRDDEKTTMDLMLNLSSKEATAEVDPNGKSTKTLQKEKTLLLADPAKPPTKTQVVGWPPVRSFRKNMLATQKSEESGNLNPIAITFVKVSMDGAPYLRKVDLKMYKNYSQLSDSLGKMFSSFTIGNCESQGMKDFMNESKLMNLLNNSDYVATYEDKDGDWMLVGDVPWEMFVESCKRLRIMKGKEAIGIAPRAMEKCKNRS
ncbi:unnamed protein product [Lathyrus sativus]|nr:unnamed protein product [Lathyrus sativus]